MKARNLMVAGSLLALSACASDGGPVAGPIGEAPAPPASAAQAAFRTSEFAWSKAAGRGRIDGQLAYNPRGGAYICTDAPVLLTPETPWVRSRMVILYKSDRSAILSAAEVRGRTPPERSQDYSAFVRRTTCDASGHFSFSGLPEGAWYVITVARPAAPGAAGREMAIMRRVTVKEGQTVSLRL